MDSFKKQATTFLSRAKQFTEEKLGGAEKTEYDPSFENLLRKADATRNRTEMIVSNVESVLQPNPNERIEDFLMTKFDKKIAKPNNLEILGHCMYDSGSEFGQNTQYGSVLLKVGEAEKKLGYIEKEFVQKAADSFVQPLKSFLEGQMKIIQKEKKTLEAKRLDLDSCKNKIKRHSENKTKPEEKQKDEEELRKAQTEFDRQLELTKLLLEELHVTHSHHARCLSDFFDAQLAYHSNSAKVLQELQKQLGLSSNQYNNNNNNNSNTNNNNNNVKLNASNNSNNNNNNSNNNIIPNVSQPLTPLTLKFSNVAINSNPVVNNGNNKVKAKVLFDYEAGDETELSVFANQIIMVQLSASDNDWAYAENGNNYGKVPKAYIQIIE